MPTSRESPVLLFILRLLSQCPWWCIGLTKIQPLRRLVLYTSTVKGLNFPNEPLKWCTTSLSHLFSVMEIPCQDYLSEGQLFNVWVFCFQLIAFRSLAMKLQLSQFSKKALLLLSIWLISCLPSVTCLAIEGSLMCYLCRRL